MIIKHHYGIMMNHYGSLCIVMYHHASLTIEATTNYCPYYGWFLLKCRSPITNQGARDQREAMHLVRALQLFLEHQNRVTLWTTPWARRWTFRWASNANTAEVFCIPSSPTFVRLKLSFDWCSFDHDLDECFLPNFGFPNQLCPLIMPAVDFALEKHLETSRWLDETSNERTRCCSVGQLVGWLVMNH